MSAIRINKWLFRGVGIHRVCFWVEDVSKFEVGHPVIQRTTSGDRAEPKTGREKERERAGELSRAKQVFHLIPPPAGRNHPTPAGFSGLQNHLSGG